jgi:hypothetical protein
MLNLCARCIAPFFILLVGACATSPAPPVKALPLLDIQHAGLLVNEQGRAELGLSLRNISAQTLWVTVRFQTPKGDQDCLLGSELSVQQDHLFICPQSSLQADENYPIAIQAYRDVDQSIALNTLATGLRFDATTLRAAGL